MAPEISVVMKKKRLSLPNMQKNLSNMNFHMNAQ